MAKLGVTVVGKAKVWDLANEITAFVWIGEKRVTCVADLVTKIFKRCAKGDTIIMLKILDHGDSSGQCIGDDYVSESTFNKHRDRLSKLRQCFDPKAVVRLGGCKVGHASGLLSKLSSLWGGVTVLAGTAYQRDLIPGIEGGVTSCVLENCSYSGENLWDKIDL